MNPTLKKSFIIFCSVMVCMASCKNIERQFESEENEEQEGAEIIGAMNEWSAARTYPYKKMVPNAFGEASDFAMRMEARQKMSKTAAVNNWTNLGPMNFSGRVISLGFDPSNQNIIYAGSAAGGLWKTTTGGTGGAGGINWTYVETGFPIMGVGCITVNPANGNEIYVGTGEVYDNGSGGADGANVVSTGNVRTFRGSYGVGIIKSTDGGLTWTKSLDFQYSAMKGVWDILIDPTNNNIVYAATTDGVYKSTNAGSSWSLIHNVVMATDIAFKPDDPATLYVACGNFASTGYGIYKSINANTASPTFSKLAGGLPGTVINGRIQLATCAANPNKVYASIGRAPATANVFALFVSSNAGTSWTQVKTATSAFTGSALNQGWYAHDVAVNPADENNIYWCEMEFFSSTNGGSTFTNKTTWSLWGTNPAIGATLEGSTGSYAHADIHRIYISPFNNATIYIVTDGGIYKSINSGGSWIGLNGGLATSQIYSNMGMSASTDFMIGGLQDNEGFIYAGSPQCKRIPNLGDGFHGAVDPTNDNNCFASSYYFNVKKSTNKGVNWSSVTSNPGVPPTENACFNAPFVLAPSNPAIMYGGTIYFKKSTDNGGSFASTMGTPLSGSGAAPILHMSVAPTDATMVYVSTAPASGVTSKLFKTTNSGTSFTQITGTLPDRYYSDIAIDPNNKNRIAVTLSGFLSSHVYLSNDGGTTWTDIGSGLPDVPANTALFDPNDSHILYIGNDIGVFVTSGLPLIGTPATAPTNWVWYNGGFGKATMVSDLIATPIIAPATAPKLRAATYGRGLWQNDFIPAAAFATLPVMMTSFTAENKGQLNELNWSISTEAVVKTYEVEYSTDGIHFTKVGEVMGKNQSSASFNYSYTDKINNNNTRVYYRIKTVDIDGRYEYSIVVPVDQQINKAKIFLYPNPARESFRIRLASATNGVVQVNIFDQGGRLMRTEKVTLVNATEISQRTDGLPAGNYMISVEGKNLSWNGKLQKVN
jgi:hypothetical protein